MTEPETLLTMDQVAQATHTSTDTLKRWCREGKCEAVKLGRQWFMTQDQYQALITHGVQVGAQRRAPNGRSTRRK